MASISLPDLLAKIRIDDSALDQGTKKAGTFGKSMKAGFAVAGAAVVGLGAFAVKAFDDFDAGLDAVAIGTGKTGKALLDLQDTFKNVNKTVVSSEEEVGTAVGVLSDRLKISGKDLEKLTKQTLDLARITKTDLGSTLDSTTRLFGDFSVATENQSKSLDGLFRISQKTKVPFDKLAATMVQFGAPLRLLGFDFAKTAALIAKFETEGVNTEAVLAGLKTGLANIASTGKPIPETFAKISQAIKDAKTTAVALTLGIETFGKRAGPDLVAAIREGRFEGLQPLIADMQNATGAISDATAGSDDFKEKWTIAMKGVKQATAEFIAPTLDLLVESLDKSKTKTDEAAGSFESAEEIGRGFALVVGGIAEAFKVVGTAIGTVLAKIVTFSEEAPDWLQALLSPLAFILGAWDRIKTAISDAGENVKKLIKQIDAIDIAKLAGALAKGVVKLVVPGLARGGPAIAGQPYVVGEKGPELFVPKLSGMIVPQNQTTAQAQTFSTKPQPQGDIIIPISIGGQLLETLIVDTLTKRVRLAY